ncbi:LacI family DNA-binding transcriptional regulator [Streptococcus macacae]|uniref:Bacterial regulatory protein, LacI family n=1 Tax=Streptococcus macacae NCTC 11558 TaxID=764298 RepID=G5JWM1_9STRE|nr:LacI family DNA-binding transcriptional regulator [Streptococcus macacae]EHJ51831.1 bacterial regulatory protein, LacI family [Streptococcus macacae NCTC 11558]SUN78811.1 maltose operon transcriptional repressor [Streptococcus macacae NCTC 11558]
MVTIKDVAKEAGVNPSTVSRVLKNNASISEKTKIKVKKAMADLGYVPNLAAQMLASGLTYCVGVVLPPLMSPDRLNDPFFMEILTAINDEATQNQFTVSIATSDTMADLKDQVQLMHRQKRVDGFIVLYSERKDPVRRYLMENEIPFVIIGAPAGLENETTYIDNDNQLMAKTAVDYLYSKGHENILFVTNDQSSDIYTERYKGYQKGMQALRLSSYQSALFDSKKATTLAAFIERIQNENITALVIIGDVISIRVIQFLSFYDIAVPEDISLISFNNSSYATLLHPYLTTFDINVSRLGRTSLHCLLEKIEDSSENNQKVLVPFTLKERESVRNLKKS